MPTAPRLFADLPPAGPLATQAERAAALRRAANHLAHRCFAPDGRWLLAGAAPDCREHLWLAGSLLTGEAADQALASALITVAPPPAMANGLDLRPAAPWCIFANNHALTILHRHDQLLTPAARARLTGWARQALDNHPGDRQADYQFHGYNDNMPAKATCGLILGGEMFGDPAAVEHGVWLLRQLRDQFARRGAVSEYNSPTYSPLTVAYLGEIAQDARDPQARALAAGCAERMWAEILGRHHPGLGFNPGPYSRAYAVDSIGQLSQMNILLWLALGEGVVPDPLAEYTREPARLPLHHSGDLPFNLAGAAWLATMRYQPPAHLVAWMRSRGYPYRMVATAERAEGAGLFGMNHAAGTILATSHHEPDLAVGTCYGDWSAGQSEEWQVAWRRRAPVRDPADVRCAFIRLVLDDARPGARSTSPGGQWQDECDWTGDHARTVAIQAGRSALVLCSPVPTLAGRALRKLRFLVAAGEHCAPLDLVELDAVRRVLWIEDGGVRLGVRFLGASCFGAAEPLSVERRDGYALCWLDLWNGPGRGFSADQLATASVGFVSEVGLAAEEDRAAFRARVLDAPLLDYEYFGQRTVRWRGAGGELALSLGLRSWGRRFATIDGRQIAEPVWEATGLPAGRLPFLDGTAAPGAFDLPFADLAAHFAPHERWAIHHATGRGPSGGPG